MDVSTKYCPPLQDIIISDKILEFGFANIKLIFGSEAWLSLFWKYINDPEESYQVYQGHWGLGGGMLTDDAGESLPLVPCYTSDGPKVRV
jgi:hypothetical protein